VVSLDGQESSELFVQRAATVRDDVDWAAHSREIAEICDRLDGIPLAIELAAARSRSMLPGDILRRLDERFRLLSGGRRTARERHQTLQAAVEWSYDLLEEDERRLFDRLAVFRGGFSLEAAEAVASGGGIDELDVVDLLDRLVDKSMVTALHMGVRSRYRLLETLRQFGESRLVETGDADHYRERHLDHFRRFVAEWDPLVRSIDQARALAELAEEINNINTALERLVDEGRWQEFRMLCGAMLGYWNSRGDNEGVRWYSILVDHAAALKPTERAHALAEASYNIAVQGMMVQGGELARRAVEAADDAGCEPSGLAYFALSLAALVDGDLERAFDHATEGERLGAAEGDLVVRLASASMRVANAVWLRHPEADALLERMEAEAGAFGIPTFVSSIRMAEGVHAMVEGDHELAETKFVEAIDIARGTVPHIVIVSALQRAVSRYQRGEPDVVEAVREALEVFAEQPVMPDLAADTWAVIAANWLREGRVEDAAVLACAAGALLASLGVRGRAETADIRQQLGDDLAALIDPGELDALIESTGEMTADDVRRFIFERID
jgi:predicted ATPase